MAVVLDTIQVDIKLAQSCFLLNYVSVISSKSKKNLFKSANVIILCLDSNCYVSCFLTNKTALNMANLP